MKNISIELKWALVFSGMTLAWMYLEKWTGLHDQYLDYHMYLTNLFAIPAIFIMVKALLDKKKSFYEGNMTYRQGFVCGLILSFIIALLSPVNQWITTYVITPEYFPNVIKRSVEIGYFKSIAEAEAQFNYQNYAIQGAIGALVMGLLTTAIAMIWLRTPAKKAT
ncbi:MAG: DUF4199 domain-containing protein [Spirosomataceae bacterium]